MNIQQKNSAHHFHLQSEREQTLSGGGGGKGTKQVASNRHLKACRAELVKLDLVNH